MPITKLTTNLSNIQAEANQVVGKATTLKVKFDKAGNDVKTYINDTLTVELDALDDANVKLTGDQAIADVKTFSSSPIVPAPTTDTQASTKKYVDDTVGATVGATVLGQLIADVVLVSDVAQVDFEGLADYKELKLIISANSSSLSQELHMRFNEDSSGNYNRYGAYNNTISTLGSQTKISFAPNILSSSTSTPTELIVDIINIKQAKVKKLFWRGYQNTDNDNSGQFYYQGCAMWINNTDFINKISLIPATNNFLLGSTFELWGVRR